MLKSLLIWDLCSKKHNGKWKRNYGRWLLNGGLNYQQDMFSDYSSTQEGDSELFRKEVLDDPALQSIKAIKNKNIIIIKDRYRYAASQYIGDAICDIAQKTYPEYFDQINN